MGSKASIRSKDFWRVLKYIESMEESQFLDELKGNYQTLYRVEIDEKTLEEAVNFLKKLSYPVVLSSSKLGTKLSFTGKKPIFKFEMSFAEWISFQAHFPLLKEYQDQVFHECLAVKLQEVEKSYSKFNLKNYLIEESKRRKVSRIFSERGPSVVKAVERAIEIGGTVLLGFDDGKMYEVFSHRLLILDGRLNIIGEDVIDRCLVSFYVENITQCDLCPQQEYKANFSQVEIEDFIYAMRSVDGSEERLVLKIANPENVNLRPPYHFLGNPYMTTNMDGELIWAASVEVSKELFRWLDKIQDDVEIVDPQEVRLKFEEHLKNKKTRNLLKKSS